MLLLRYEVFTLSFSSVSIDPSATCEELKFAQDDWIFLDPIFVVGFKD